MVEVDLSVVLERGVCRIKGVSGILRGPIVCVKKVANGIVKRCHALANVTKHQVYQILKHSHIKSFTLISS